MGIAAEVGIVVCALVGRTDMAIYAICALGAVALVSVGGQSVVDAMRSWFEGRPFVLDPAKKPGVVEPEEPWERPAKATPLPETPPLSTLPPPPFLERRHP